MFVAKKSPRNKENCPPDIKPITYPRRLKRLDSSFSIDSSLNESMESLTNILTETTNNLSVSGCFDTSRVEDSSQCFNGNFKRRKSVRFDEENNSLHDDMPLPLKRKDSITKNPVPILKKKTSLDGSVRDNSQISLSNASFALRSDRQPAASKMLAPRTSLLDERINERKRYSSLLEGLKKNKKKYYDDIFPPEAASIYYSPKDTKYGDVKWVRVSEINRGKYCTLFSK